MPVKETSTETRIKEAARQVFQEKGYSATKTRDITEAADINLALLNYYFRSKKKLFDIIMTETLQSFFAGILVILNDEKTSAKEKITLFVDHYIDLLTEHKHMASFILNTVRAHPEEYIKKIGILNKVKKSIFVDQFNEGVMNGSIPPLNPIHFLMNLVGLVVFPFIAQPMITAASGIPEEPFYILLQERKQLIPKWIEAMLQVKH